MIDKKKTLIFSAIAMIVLFSTVIAYPAYAKDHSARLKECLQTDYMYLSTSVVSLNNSLISDKTQFKNTYDNHYVVLSGDLKATSISKNKKEVSVSDTYGNQCIVDTSSADVKKVVEGLNVGDNVVVYGKLSVTGIRKDSYKLTAIKILIGSKQFAFGSYVFDPDEAYKGVAESSLSGTVSAKYYVPQSWNRDYVRSKLTNNGVRGYQYYLNALSPQSPQDDAYPEIFSIFYFNNETYLDRVPTNPSDGDNKDIEELIVRNIHPDLEEKKIKIETIKDCNGQKFDYFSTTYHVDDGKNNRDYRLEFMFKPGRKGIICMLYLYYPSEEAVKHLREAAYLVGTVSLEE